MGLIIPCKYIRVYLTKRENYINFQNFMTVLDLMVLSSFLSTQHAKRKSYFLGMSSNIVRLLVQHVTSRIPFQISITFLI